MNNDDKNNNDYNIDSKTNKSISYKFIEYFQV